jgi:hypothetical protein
MKRIRYTVGQCMLRTPLNKWYTECILTSHPLLHAAKKLYILVTEPELNLISSRNLNYLENYVSCVYEVYRAY